MEYIIDSKSLNKCKELKSKEVNLLPCNIEYSGPAEVDSYFIIKDTDEVINNDQKVYISAFRGRGLKGVESNTTNYTGNNLNYSHNILYFYKLIKYYYFFL